MNSKIKRKKNHTITGILKAIQYLHNKGITHGDIKAENILLDHNMNPKLYDFGYAKYNSNSTNNMNRGTINYSSPELLLGDCIDYIKSDIWAIGITMYVISEKEFPFDCDDDNYSMYQITHGYIYVNPDDKLQYIIANCIKMNPKERININDILNDEYFNY